MTVVAPGKVSEQSDLLTAPAQADRSSRRPRRADLDVMRVLAAFAIVLIHVAGQGVVHIPTSNWGWWCANFWDAAARWSVPGFVMLSGALLLTAPRDPSIWMFYRRRLSRIGIPLVFWTVAYLVWRSYYVPEHLTFTQVWRQLLWGIPAFHLYFLFLIFGMYLFAPMFRATVDGLSRGEVAWLAFLALLFASASHSARTFLQAIEYFSFERFVPYVGYFLAGYLMANIRLTTRWRIAAIAGLVLATAGSVGVMGWIYTGKRLPEWQAIGLCYDYLSPLVVVQTLSIFALIVDAYHQPGAIRRAFARVCGWISPAAFGIYLVHVMVLWEVFTRFTAGSPDNIAAKPNPLVASPLWALAIFTASLVVTRIVQLVPGLRRIMG